MANLDCEVFLTRQCQKAVHVVFLIKWKVNTLPKHPTLRALPAIAYDMQVHSSFLPCKATCSHLPPAGSSGTRPTLRQNFVLEGKKHDYVLINELYKRKAGGSDGKESACNAGDLGSVPGSGRPPPNQRRKWQPTPVFLPGEFLAGYSPWGRKESDTTEQLTQYTRSHSS